MELEEIISKPGLADLMKLYGNVEQSPTTSFNSIGESTLNEVGSLPCVKRDSSLLYNYLKVSLLNFYQNVFILSRQL